LNTTIAFILIFTIISCKEDIQMEEFFKFNIKFVDENSVTVDWKEMNASYVVRFLVDHDDLFNNPIITKEVGLSENEIILTGLNYMSDYFMKIEAMDKKEVIWNEVIEFSSGYTSESVRFLSAGDVGLCANVRYIYSKLNIDSKVVIFLHEFEKSKTSWNTTGIVDTAISSYENVIGGVAASAVRDLSELMLDEELKPKGMFYIAGELDKSEILDRDCERDAYYLFGLTKEASRVEILYGSRAQGVDLLANEPVFILETIRWV